MVPFFSTLVLRLVRRNCVCVHIYYKYIYIYIYIWFCYCYLVALTNILITWFMCSGSRRRVCKQSSPSGVDFPQYKNHFLIFCFINSQSWRGCSLSLFCLCISNCEQVAFKAGSIICLVSCTWGPLLLFAINFYTTAHVVHIYIISLFSINNLISLNL